MSNDQDKSNLKETISETITDYALSLQQDDEDQIGFWASWNRLYVFIIFYGILQIMALYIFTLIFNRK